MAIESTRRQVRGGTASASSHPPLPPRSHLAEAAALYNLVDDQLHVLVTVSNHLLRRLELRVRLGHLEAAIHQVRGLLLGDTVLYRGHFVLELKYQPLVLGRRQETCHPISASQIKCQI